jgi:hypothetical protein
LAIDAPKWAPWWIPSCLSSCITDLLICRAPMSSWCNIWWNLGPQTSQGQCSWSRTLRSSERCLSPWKISSNFSWIEKRWIVHELVTNHSVHALGGYLVVS